MNNSNIYLNSVAKICQKELDVLNIPYAKGIEFSVNHRAKSRWGQCRINRATGKYSINIAEVLCEPKNVIGLKNTIIHELLHSVPNGMSHTGEWKRFANIVNKHYGYNIKRGETEEEKGCKLEKDYKYVAVCEHCGQVIKRQKKSDFIKHMENYSCSKCGGTFKLVQGE